MSLLLLANRLSGSALRGIVLGDAPLAMRRPEGAMASIPEERRVKVGTSCHRFEVKALSNWTELELTAIYHSLGARRREDFAGACVMDLASTCLRIPLRIPPWKTNVSSLKFPLDLIIFLHIWGTVLPPFSPLAGPVPAEQTVAALNYWKVVVTCTVWDSESWYLATLHPGVVVYGFEEDSKLRLPGSQALSHRPWNDGKDGFVMMRCERTGTLHFEKFTAPIAPRLDLGASIYVRGRGEGDSVLLSQKPFTCHQESWQGWHCYVCGCDVPKRCSASVAEKSNEKPTIRVDLLTPRRSMFVRISEYLVLPSSQLFPALLCFV